MVVLIGAAVVVALIVLVAYKIVFKKKVTVGRSGTKVVLCGPSGAGKTAILGVLYNEKWHDTVSSFVPTEVACDFEDDGRTRRAAVIDVPGHDGLRGVLSQVVRDSKCIVVVVDASTVTTTDLTATASILHDVLVSKEVNKQETPILVACNKSDLMTSTSAASIEKALARELTSTRNTRSAMVAVEGAEDDEEDEPIFLGYKDSDFSFKDVPMEVSFERCSARNGTVEAIHRFVIDSFS